MKCKKCKQNHRDLYNNSYYEYDVGHIGLPGPPGPPGPGGGQTRGLPGIPSLSAQLSVWELV